jgi:arsenate reductase (thioredoxin)
MTSPTNTLLPALATTVNKLVTTFAQIPLTRKPVLQELIYFVAARRKEHRPIALNFICTHNSRRSHLSQIWAHTAAAYYDIKDVHCYSGGTEATAFNPRAVTAMQSAGFEIQIGKDGQNPIYEVRFAEGATPLTVFSKKYDDDFNPKADFAAVMTCSHADENCPIIFGASKRIALTYDDPKAFDGTPQEAAKYSERVEEIGREILFAFSQVK